MKTEGSGRHNAAELLARLHLGWPYVQLMVECPDDSVTSPGSLVLPSQCDLQEKIHSAGLLVDFLCSLAETGACWTSFFPSFQRHDL
jgi:hypothetical protein